VTNHLACIHVANLPTLDDDALDQSGTGIDAGVDAAVEPLLTCEPDAFVLRVSNEAVYGDPTDGDVVQNRYGRSSRAPTDSSCTQATRSQPRSQRSASPMGPSHY
jgi:hypothetical protein